MWKTLHSNSSPSFLHLILYHERELRFRTTRNPGTGKPSQCGKVLIDKSNVDEHPITSTIEQPSTSNSSLKPTNWVDKIGLRINAEIRGIERVPESERHDNSLLSPFLVFLSPNMVISDYQLDH